MRSRSHSATFSLNVSFSAADRARRQAARESPAGVHRAGGPMHCFGILVAESKAERTQSEEEVALRVEHGLADELEEVLAGDQRPRRAAGRSRSPGGPET